MCIRDRDFVETSFPSGVSPAWPFAYGDLEPYYGRAESLYRCLLYTSDAADERSSVDLGGRRIIKKKTKVVITRIVARADSNSEHQPSHIDYANRHQQNSAEAVI